MYRWSEQYPRLWAALESASAVIIACLLAWVTVVVPPVALLGLLGVTGSVVRGTTGDALGRFARAVKRGFWTGLLLGLIDLALGVILYVDFRFLAGIGSSLGRFLIYVLAPITVAMLMVNAFAWPLLAWFPQRLGPLLKRSLYLTGAHPLWALGALAGPALTALALLFVPGLGYGLVVAVGPGVVAVVWAWFAWRAMGRYASADDVED